MPVKILGIHDGHNASAVLLVDGQIVFAIQEERLTRVKNQGGIPQRAIHEILERTGYQLSDIDFFALDGQYMVHYGSYREATLDLYSKSFSGAGKMQQRLRHSLKRVPPVDNMYRNLHQQKRLNRLAQIGVDLAKVIPVEHHTAHAAAAYYGFRTDTDVLVLTCDARGDRLCGSVSIGRGGRLERLAGIGEDESIGRVYSLVTYLMGMVPLEHEYKIMGLAPYAKGNDKHVDRIFRKFAGLFEMDPEHPLVWKRRRGVPSIYAANDLIEKLIRHERFDWIAAGLQKFIEVFLSEWVRSCVRETRVGTVALSGGVFMNVKLNKRILELPEVEELFVFPSCGDETNAVGAAYWVYAHQSDDGRCDITPVRDLYWGGDFSDMQAERAIEAFEFTEPVNWVHQDDIERRVAELIASGEVVARAKGRMEFGARALGNRSILADPRSPKVTRLINEMIKNRDFWMPFAPSALGERVNEYCIKPKPVLAPYMILTFDTRPEKVSALLAAIHPYDYTTRPQEVYQEWNAEYYRLIKHYEALTGEGILLNTSFNLHGFPIVYTPYDALEVFDQSGLEYLALGNILISKNRR